MNIIIPPAQAVKTVQAPVPRSTASHSRDWTTERETEIWRNDDGVVQLSVTLEYPLICAVSCSAKAAAAINRYYKKRNSHFIELCSSLLLPKIKAEPDPARLRLPVTATLSGRVTYCADDKLSVLTDLSFSALAESSRHADLWLLSSGSPLPVSALGLNKSKLRKKVVAELALRRQRFPDGFQYPEARSRVSLYPDVEARAARHFSVANIYINSNGKTTVFFPLNTVAPRGEGFVSVPVKNA